MQSNIVIERGGAVARCRVVAVGILRRQSERGECVSLESVAARGTRWRHNKPASATLPLCASCERKTERLPYYLRATLPLRTAYVDYEDTAFTFDHPVQKHSFISRFLTDIEKLNTPP